MIFDSHVSLKESSELERTEVDIPQAVVYLFQAHILSDDGGGDVYPLSSPSDPAIGTDVSHFEAVWVFNRRKLVGHRSVGGHIKLGGGIHVERLVGSLLVELAFESIELALLRAAVGGRRLGGLVLERAVHALMLAILLRLSGLDELRKDAQTEPPGRQLREPAERVAGKGHTPLSVRMHRGSPYCLKSRVKTILLGVSRVPARAWHSSR